jgi:hypothetical protein
MTARRWTFIAGKPFLPEHDNPVAADRPAAALLAPGSGSSGAGGTRWAAPGLGGPGWGGTEQAIIHLTNALAALGETVTVIGGSATPRVLNGVIWQPSLSVAEGPASLPGTDVTVAINDARLLPRGAPGPAIWFHNEVEFGKEFRRGRLPALLRARPTAIFIGTEQAQAAPRALPFRRRVIIPYGLSNRILAAPPTAAPPPPAAMFTSQAYRGLKNVLAMWQKDVAPELPGARFRAYIAAGDVPAFAPLVSHPGVAVAARIGNDAVLAQLLQTRVSETFCLAAAEAIALGVPVVTLGIGSLKERVRDGVDGFICRDFAEMAARTRALLTDDALWRRMQAAGIAARADRGWSNVAQKWREASTSF